MLILMHMVFFFLAFSFPLSLEEDFQNMVENFLFFVFYSRFRDSCMSYGYRSRSKSY